MPAGGLMGHHTGMLCRKGKACASARRREKTLAPCREKLSGGMGERRGVWRLASGRRRLAV